MKIWVIGRNYPTEKNKMCGSFEYEQAQMLARQGHEVSYLVCPFHPLYKIRKWGDVDWQEGDIHVYAHSQFYFPQRMNVYWDSFKRKRWKALLEKVEGEQGLPDIIHLHYPTMISVPDPILAYKFKGSRIIATEHWTSVLTGKITEHAMRQLKVYADEADHFICVGKPLKESIVKLTGTKREIEVVPNIVPDTFECERKAHEGIRFISIGRLVNVKQFDKLIDAFAGKFRGSNEVSLTIVGGGGQSGKLRKQIQRLGMEKQIILTGAKNRMDVAELLAESDALISYSRLETFGVPVIEAWYSGIPAIATKAIGFSEYWREKLGNLISCDKENELEDAMEDVKNKIGGGYYDPLIISQYARDNFSETAVYQKLIALYQK